MVFFLEKRNRKLLIKNRKTFAYGLVVIFGAVSVILFTVNKLSFLKDDFSLQRSKRQVDNKGRWTSNDQKCLDRFITDSIKLSNPKASSCRKELEKEYDSWNISLGYNSACVYWCDSTDYPKSMFKIRTRQQGAFLFYRVHFQNQFSTINRFI